jgi:2-polyprenyl-3-methyl-5-hydroxy-6-metoxy-1,4-benzoquinol methylase
MSEGDCISEKIDALNSIAIFKNTTRSILDYACGVGKEVALLSSMGYNVIGYDKCIVHTGVLNKIDNMMFDIIYNINFIEHLIRPIQDIKQILKHLNKNGYLIFVSDAIDKYMIEYTHFHTYFYAGNSMYILFDKLNLEIIENKTVGIFRVIVLRYAGPA